MVKEGLVSGSSREDGAGVERGWANGKKFFYYAEDTSGLGRTWSGEFVTPIPSRAFDWCWDTGSTDSRDLGLKKLQIPSQIPPILDYTINLR